MTDKATLTDHGIDLETDPFLSVEDYLHDADNQSGHLELVTKTDGSYVFADTAGHELHEWADAMDVGLNELSESMHELAHDLTNYDWSHDDPVVVVKND